ncbi:MAG TPA: hypothetical protein VK749_22335 [Xanthobacteraceae bacterium]|jgi:hypothetical protein|nr:hypothetical protein [Xanthobacteraceae bacterium]
MSKNYLFAATAGLCLFGCTTSMPRPNAAVNAEQITYAVISEFYCAVQDLRDHNFQVFNPKDQWILAVELNLSAAIEGSVSPSVSLLGPLNAVKALPTGQTANSFTTAIGASLDQTRTNARDYKIYIDVNRLMYMPGSTGSSGPVDPSFPTSDWKSIASSLIGPVTCPYPNGARTYLAGNLGIEDWLGPTYYTQINTRLYAPAPAGKSATLTFGPSVIRQGGTPNRTRFVRLNVNQDFQVAQDQPAPSAAPSPSQSSSAGLTEDQQKLVKETAKEAAKEFANELNKSNAATVGALLAAATGGGGGQSPTIGVTFTFTIKSGGNIGPAFTLTRVSGGSNSFFSVTRTDTNYVNLVLTPTSYCPIAGQVPDATTGKCGSPSHKDKAEADFVSAASIVDVEQAVGRIENTLFTLNVNRALSP